MSISGELVRKDGGTVTDREIEQRWAQIDASIARIDQNFSRMVDRFELTIDRAANVAEKSNDKNALEHDKIREEFDRKLIDMAKRYDERPKEFIAILLSSIGVLTGLGSLLILFLSHYH